MSATIGRMLCCRKEGTVNKSFFFFFRTFLGQQFVRERLEFVYNGHSHTLFHK